MNRDLKAITKKFFAAYDAHDVDSMLTLCAEGAQGRYVPFDASVGDPSDLPLFYEGRHKRYQGERSLGAFNRGPTRTSSATDRSV